MNFLPSRIISAIIPLVRGLANQRLGLILEELGVD